MCLTFGFVDQMEMWPGNHLENTFPRWFYQYFISISWLIRWSVCLYFINALWCHSECWACIAPSLGLISIPSDTGPKENRLRVPCRIRIPVCRGDGESGLAHLKQQQGAGLSVFLGPCVNDHSTTEDREDAGGFEPFWRFVWLLNSLKGGNENIWRVQNLAGTN